MAKRKPGPLNIATTAPQSSNNDAGGSFLPKSGNVNEIDDILSKLVLTDKQTELVKDFWQTKEKLKGRDLQPEDFEKLGELGVGNGGVVYKVNHKPTGIVMARKLIHLEIKPTIRFQIMRELEILHKCISPYIIGYFGYFHEESDISICMEHMDGGSLDQIMKKCGRIPEPLISIITRCVLLALDYLRKEHKILHRDVKPSNILMNTRGHIKMCDFGVSGQLTDSMARSFVGTRSYMAPERLSGQEYSVQSDMWSVGLSVCEMALGRYPIPMPTPGEFKKMFPGDIAAVQAENEEAIRTGTPLKLKFDGFEKAMSVFDMLEYIVNEELPSLPSSAFSAPCIAFVDQCLNREPRERGDLASLLGSQFVINNRDNDIDVGGWLTKILQRYDEHN